jgi:hypothetical protein
MRPSTALVACTALLAVGLARDAAAIVRCESADGKVTYSNAECPPGTKLVRNVELAPPVVVHEGAAPATKTAAPRQPARIESARPRREENPVQLDQELSAQLEAQRRECEARIRQIRQLQEDVESAAADARASAELVLRRAQDDYRALCPRQR